MTERYTAEHLAQCTHSMLGKWSIPMEDVQFIVTDDAQT
jgi:hypothetical protein